MADRCYAECCVTVQGRKTWGPVWTGFGVFLPNIHHAIFDVVTGDWMAEVAEVAEE